ncbi:hypothetical protein NKH63_28705 [Mesorhizobium sp. M0960]|uniref:hypothetical protein n=1 Tax=Mesorhizobium sp. M0960 TaxID=2957035 RepID=UPI003337E383
MGYPRRKARGGALLTPVLWNDRLRERRQLQPRLDCCGGRLPLGGLAAEEVLLGAKSAAGGGTRGSDLTFEASYGLGERLAYIAADNEGDLFTAMRFDRGLQERVDRVLLEQFERAKRIVGERRTEVERIAEALFAKGALSAEEIKEVVELQPRLQLELGKRAV